MKEYKVRKKKYYLNLIKIKTKKILKEIEIKK